MGLTTVGRETAVSCVKASAVEAAVLMAVALAAV